MRVDADDARTRPASEFHEFVHFEQGNTEFRVRTRGFDAFVMASSLPGVDANEDIDIPEQLGPGL